MSDVQKYKGQVLALDVNDSERAIALTAERDENGKGLLRVINVDTISPLTILSGNATGGMPGYLEDINSNFEPNIFTNKLIKITNNEIDYIREIISNNDTEIILSTPLEAPTQATAVIGEVNAGQVTITVKEFGLDGNGYIVQFIEAPGTDDNLSASLMDMVLTVYLGMSGGVLDDSKNTATAISDTINQIGEFTAEMTGAGGAMGVTAEPIPFTGGDDGISVSVGDTYEIFNKNADNLENLIGEVQEEPTLNTLLGRMKSLEDRIQDIHDGTAVLSTELTGSLRQQAFSTAIPLNNGASYVSPVIDGLNFRRLRFGFKADQTGAYAIKFSDDGVTFLGLNSVAYGTANAVIEVDKEITGRYIQITWQNTSGVNQTSFNLFGYLCQN